MIIKLKNGDQVLKKMNFKKGKNLKFRNTQLNKKEKLF